MLCAMSAERLAGSQCSVQHIIPSIRVMIGPEDDTTDQAEAKLVQSLAQDGRIFRHEANRTKFDPFIASLGTIAENLTPRGIARVICKLNPPRTRGVSDLDAHSSIPFTSEIRRFASFDDRPTRKLSRLFS